VIISGDQEIIKPMIRCSQCHCRGARARTLSAAARSERKGYLSTTEYREERSLRIVYRATPSSEKHAAKEKVRELFDELIEGWTQTALAGGPIGC
jgi:hypothetical protein